MRNMIPTINRYKYRRPWYAQGQNSTNMSQGNLSGVLDDLGLTSALNPIIDKVSKTLDNVDNFTVYTTIGIWVLGGLAVAWLYFYKK
jgi:hypothetical protein